MYRNLVFALALCLPVVGCSGTVAQDCDHAKKMRAYQATRLAVAVMNTPDTTPDEDDVEQCDGSGYITHGDGHRTPCPGCPACKGKDGKEPVAADIEPEYNVYHFGAKWCGPCKQMIKNTWPDEKMVKFLKDKKAKLFVFDVDNKDHKKFFSYYKVTSYPTIILLDKDNLNKPLQRNVGGMSAESMIKQLDKVL
jgi:thiol-disulfide isomerase/thioredoxin